MIALAAPETALYVAEHLRQKDIDGLSRIIDGDPREHVFETARDSLLSWVVIAPDGEPVCLFGANADEGADWAGAWMFSTDRVEAGKWSLCRGIRKAIQYGLTHWPELRIYPEARDEQQTRFLEFCGFSVLREIERNGRVLKELTTNAR